MNFLPPIPRILSRPSLRALARFVSLLVLIAGFSSSILVRAEEPIYVSPSGSDDATGTRDAPFATIQHALDAAPSGGEVILLPGTFMGDGNRDITYRGKPLLVRSEAGRETTIVSGGSGSEGLEHRGFLFDSGETAASVLEGVTIRDFKISYGAGIGIFNSSPVIRDCVISNNRTNPMFAPGPFGEILADSIGAGICIAQGAPSLEHCSIVENTAIAGGNGFQCLGGKGAGLSAYGTNLILEDCSISRNISQNGDCAPGAEGLAGGVKLEASTVRLDRCTVADNIAYDVAGVWVRGGDVCLINCTLSANTGTAFGCPLPTARVHFEHCTVAFNSGHSPSLPGGIVANPSASVSLRNSLIVFNDVTSSAQISSTILSMGYNILSDNNDDATLLGTDAVSPDFSLPITSTPLRDGHYFSPGRDTSAIDGAIPVPGIEYDQRELPRSCDADMDTRPLPDIGAVELHEGECAPSLGLILEALLGRGGRLIDINGDGVVDASDLIPPVNPCLP